MMRSSCPRCGHVFREPPPKRERKFPEEKACDDPKCSKESCFGCVWAMTPEEKRRAVQRKAAEQTKP